MARRPLPVDPDEGPLQAFAYDLRQLREKAGNPTYRILARKAGYSPATLSEAARGQRRPSLDVTLAYVGACGGDPDEWRLRWHDLAEADTGTATTADAGTEPADPADAAAPAEPAPQPSPTRSRRWMRPAVLSAAVVLAATATGAVAWTRPWASDEPRPGGCPRARAGAGVFTGQTYSFTRVRTEPALSAPVTSNVPAGCSVAFSGYCLGDVVTDATSGTPDTRWFALVGGGVMASAVVHGNPPANLGPSACPGSLTPPSAIHLDVRRVADELRLQATGQGLKIVGFASLDTAEAGDPRWHQINSLTRSPASVFETRWRPHGGTQASSDRHITVAAVACLGGDGPTAVIDAQEIQPGGSLRTTSTSLSGTAMEAATASACQYTSHIPKPDHS